MSTIEIDVIEDSREAATLLEPTRLRLMESLAEPRSGAQLARELELPRQRVNYHLRELEKAGLVELVEERRKGNCQERLVRAKARSYLIGPGALGPIATDPSKLGERFSWAYLVGVAARIIRELASLRRRADKAGKGLPTLTIDTEVRFANASSQQAFAEELTREVARLVAKHHDGDTPDGRRYRLVVGSYPRPKADDDTAAPRDNE